MKSSESLVCPACGRDFGVDERGPPPLFFNTLSAIQLFSFKLGAWLALHNHVRDSKDLVHSTWRNENPEVHGKEFEEEVATLWHILRQMPSEELYGPKAALKEDAGERIIRFVNRLDAGTSGIIVVAQTLEVAAMVLSCLVLSCLFLSRLVFPCLTLLSRLALPCLVFVFVVSLSYFALSFSLSCLCFVRVLFLSLSLSLSLSCLCFVIVLSCLVLSCLVCLVRRKACEVC